MRTNRFLQDETHALVFARKLAVFRLKEVDYVRTDKNGPVTGLASRCTHLKGITELSKAIGAKV